MKPSFSPAIERVLSALFFSRQGTIDVCPLVPVLAKIMLHFIDEWEVFAMLTHLMSRTAWLDQGQSQLSASLSTLQHLLITHAVSVCVCCVRGVTVYVYAVRVVCVLHHCVYI